MRSTCSSRKGSRSIVPPNQSYGVQVAYGVRTGRGGACGGQSRSCATTSSRGGVPTTLRQRADPPEHPGEQSVRESCPWFGHGVASGHSDLLESLHGMRGISAARRWRPCTRAVLTGVNNSGGDSRHRAVCLWTLRVALGRNYGPRENRIVAGATRRKRANRRKDKWFTHRTGRRSRLTRSEQARNQPDRGENAYRYADRSLHASMLPDGSMLTGPARARTSCGRKRPILRSVTPTHRGMPTGRSRSSSPWVSMSAAIAMSVSSFR